MATALTRLRALLAEQGGLIATLLAPAEVADGAEDRHGGNRAEDRHSGASDPARLAASGPRTAARRDDYELLVEAIYEGYLLHYGVPRIVRTPEADLGLLAGDQLYAVGLAQLVQLRDTVAVAELADTITLSALAQGAGAPELADAVWTAGARAVGWGPSADHRRAKELLRAGAPEALAAMRTSASAPSTHAIPPRYC